MLYLRRQYRIRCKSCEKNYIGQTARTLKIRMKEYSKALKIDYKNSLL